MQETHPAARLGLGPFVLSRRMLSQGWPQSRHACFDSEVPISPSTDPIDTAKTVIQADVTGAKYRGMLQTLPELYRTNGMAR